MGPVCRTSGKKASTHLKKFSEREGHCQVPYSYKTEDGYRLGPWVTRQRRSKNKIDSNRRQRLEALPGLVMGCLVGPVGRGLLSSEYILSPRGSLPSSHCLQDRRRLSVRSVG